MSVSLSLEVEALSRPANHLKALLVPGATVQTVIPLAGLAGDRDYKDWVLLEQPKFGCVNVHISRDRKPDSAIDLRQVMRAPLFRCIPHYDSEGSEPSSPDPSQREFEVLLHPTPSTLKPKAFSPLCDFAFFMGIDTVQEGGGVVRDEEIPYLSLCQHSLCQRVAKDTKSEYAGIAGNLAPSLIYSHPAPPPYPCLPSLCFPCGLQICFNEKPPENHHFVEILEDGKVCYIFIFYGAVSAVEIGARRPATVFVPTAFGLISTVKDQWMMSRIAESLIHTFLLDTDLITLRSSPCHHESLSYLTDELPCPSSPCQTLRFHLQSVSFDCSGPDFYTLPITICRKPDRMIADEALITAFSSLLMDRKVVVVSQIPSKAAEMAVYLRDLLYPLDWPHAVIPLLPLVMLDLLNSPLPLIAGVLESYLPVIRAAYPDLMSEIVLIRIDLDVVSDPRPAPDLPKAVISKLRADLKTKNSDNGQEDWVKMAFLSAISGLLGPYKEFVAYTNGVAYLNKQNFIQSAPIGNRKYLERLTETYSFARFLQHHSEASKYCFHKLSSTGETEGRRRVVGTVYVAPPACEAAIATSSSGTIRDVLPSPRRLPTFDTFQDFSYSESDDDAEITLASGCYRPIGVPVCRSDTSRCFVLPEGAQQPPRDAETVLPARLNSFSSGSTASAARTISSTQLLIYRLLTADPRHLPSTSGQLLRILLTSNVEPGELQHFAYALEDPVVRRQFVETLKEMQDGKGFEVRYRAFVYIGELGEAILGESVRIGDFRTAVKMLAIADRLYYITPRGSKDYLIAEYAGETIWSRLGFWQAYLETLGPLQSQTAFTEITKAAGFMARLEVEVETAKKIVERLGEIYRLQPDLSQLLPILTAKSYLAQQQELEEDDTASLS